MKRIAAALLSAALMITVLCFSGCDDFAFNPIGRWDYVEHSYYVDDKLTDQETPDNTALMKDIALIFGKSGTGYVETGTKDKIDYTYKYESNTVTLTMPGSVTVDYSVSDDQKELRRTNEQSVRTSDGKEVKIKEIFVYRR